MNISFSSADLSSLAVDILVVGVLSEAASAGNLASSLSALDAPAAFNGALQAAARDEEFTGRTNSTLLLSSLGHCKAKRVLLVGVGSGAPNELRAAAGVVGYQARIKGAKSLALAFPGAAGSLRVILEALSEGNYRFDKYKSEAFKKAGLESITLAGVEASTSNQAAIATAEATIAGQKLTRDLVNEPAAEIYPESLAAVASGLAGEHLTVTVWDEKTIREKGMGGIAAVGQASSRPPRFIHISWNPPGATEHIALVGKGVTFDSGGLSLKSNENMLTMRCDMGGAASVIGIMKTISILKPKVRVDGIVGAVENMPGSNAYKLGDILKFYNGKRAEIHNTDAEGRLVLADCLAYASELKPGSIVDLATLTGAAVIALGDWYTAMYTRSDDLSNAIVTHAADAGDGVWRMPLVELYRDKLKSDFADLKNVGGRAGGSITAALFLSEFVRCDKWAHLDIAGPAFLEAPLLHFAPGGTGTMVRTLVRWVEGLAK
jgi:leucyl aminopeptidase